MSWRKESVYAKDGALYSFDEHWSNATKKVSATTFSLKAREM